MKTIIIHHFKIFATLACIVALLTSCDLPLVRNYDYDSNPDGVRFRTVLEHFENNYDKSCTMYCRAIRLAGLQETIESGGMTLVAPNNAAFASLLSLIGVESLEEINPAILRSLLLYLIFPGDFRSSTMTPDENYRSESLAGDPIFIKRSPTSSNKYRIVLNDNSEELSSGAVTVVQQDYLFKNQVVVQVVGSFITYIPRIAATQQKPSDYHNPPDVSTAILTVTEDASIYQGGGGTGISTYGSGIQIVGRAGNQRIGLFKFPLNEISFKEDISSATLVNRIYNVVTYSIGEECTLQFRECQYNDWVKSQVTWHGFRESYATPQDRAPAVIGRINFTVISLTASDWAAAPVDLRTDVTPTVSNYYLRDSAYLSIMVEDVSANYLSTGSNVQLCDKDNKQFSSTIELVGPFPSAITLLRNNPVAVSDGVAVLNPDSHFAMAGPAVSDGYNYADRNIIYVVKTPPAGGILTVYGIPARANSRFTQAEMSAGVVKYLRTTGTSDSFGLKVLDYLGGLYYVDGNPGILTVNVN